MPRASDVCLLSTGNMLPEAIEAAHKLKDKGISAKVVSFHTVKPLDEACLKDAFDRFKLVATIEEHSLIGGFGAAVSEWLVDTADAAQEIPALRHARRLLQEIGRTGICPRDAGPDRAPDRRKNPSRPASETTAIMKTEAALLVQTGKPLVLAEIEIPALKPGQVLVEIAYSGACGTQVMEWRGDKGEDKWVPHCLGHEGTGTVLETGSAVTKVKAGDKVVLSWIKGNGIEAGGAVYDWDGKKVNAGGVTTFQRHAVVSENRLTLLPPDLPMDVAVLLGCAAPTGMGAVYNVLKVQPGDAVAVFGTGGIGLNALMAAALGRRHAGDRDRSQPDAPGACQDLRRDPCDRPIGQRRASPRSGRSCRRASIWRWNPRACRR